MKKILIIDDEEKLRSLLGRIISLEGYEVFQAGTCRNGLDFLKTTEIDVVLCDVKLPDGSGVDLVKTIRQSYPATEIILLTAYGNIPDGVQAIKNGAFDYITKGDDNNKIIPLLHKAMEKAELTRRVSFLERQLSDRLSFDSIIGSSKPIQQALLLAKKVSGTDTTVLLTGETGTGKEVFAQAIHQAGKRSSKNFVAINCSAFSKELLESEMFGHKAGAFSGALKDQKGLFSEADHGTIFLDEIGEMPVDLQAKLLRVIETGEFFRVGDSKPSRTDVRIIAATNRDLLKEIASGTFREDLYYRISVFQIELPPLRERVSDIEPLARVFSAIFSAKTNQPVKSFSEPYLKALCLHQWKGNIRELKNVIERSVILSESETIDIETLPYEMQTGNTGESSVPFTAFDLKSAELLHIRKILNYTDGNKTEAARLLNIALTTLYRKLEEYHIL